jgi:hypothetical protein
MPCVVLVEKGQERKRRRRIRGSPIFTWWRGKIIYNNEDEQIITIIMMMDIQPHRHHSIHVNHNLYEIPLLLP